MQISINATALAMTLTHTLFDKHDIVLEKDIAYHVKDLIRELVPEDQIEYITKTVVNAYALTHNVHN